MNHLAIRNKLHLYEIDGAVNDEADLPDLVETLYDLLVEHMRDEGYVPMLDLPPRIYNTMHKGGFKVIVQVFGMYVGKRRSKEYEGVSNWKLFKRPSTHPTKQSRS
jgi:hypothetical protein